ncbi:MAG TPA: MFS transporter, partial [Streptosporangiaceae bacterium]
MSFRVGTLRNRAEERPAAARGEPGAPRLGWLLAVACVAQFMVILDLTIVNVALPSIQTDLNFSPINLPWVVDAYAIVFAGFLMLGGRVSDRFGPRRTLAGALVLFAAASLAGGAANSQQMLIGARCLQGLSGALMAASSLAAITMSFPMGPARHRAIALWGAMNGAGGAAGALFGGVITQELGWRWVLLINPPIGVAAAGIAFLVIAEGGRRAAGAGFDLPGALTLTIGQMVLVYGIVNSGQYGWGSPKTLVPIAIAIVILALFSFIETRASAPLVPFKAIHGVLADSNLIVFVFSAALFPMWFLSSLYLQEVLGLSPLDAGLAFFPMALTIFLTAQQAGRLVGIFGVRMVLTSGLILLGSGMLLFTRILPTGSSLGFVVLPGVLCAIGIGLSIVPSTIAATQGATPQQAGLASGLVNTSRQAGGGLGIALLISFATSYTSHLIGSNHPVPDSLTAGFRLGYLIAACLALTAALITFIRLPKATPAQAKVPAQAAPADGAEHAATAAPARSRSHLRMPAVALAILAVFVTADFAFAGRPGAPIGSYKLDGAYTFVSAPGLHPPIVRPAASHTTGTPAPGYILTGNFYDLTKPPMTGQSGPLMLDNNLQPMWFRPVPTSMVSSNLSQQTYQGKPVLVYWQGLITNAGATTSGQYIVVNQHYQTVATLRGADGWVLTLHTMQIVGDHAYVTANKNIPMDLSRWGGVSNGALDDSAVQEYNLTTGRLLRSWDAFRHISLSDSHSLPPGNGFPWDAYHVNSVDVIGQDTVLVSMRDTWGLYKINLATQKIDWTMGGRHSDFAFAPNALFKYQHDATLLPNGQISLFDDHCCFLESGGTYLAPDGPSRGLVIKYDVASHTVALVRQVRHYDENGQQGHDASYMGSNEVLPNQHLFVGYGNLPFFAEYDANGNLVMDALFPGSDLTYRAIKIPA